MSQQRFQAPPQRQLHSGDTASAAQGHAAGPVQAGGSDQQLIRLNLMRALERYRRLALGCALAGLLLAVAYVIKAWPVYMAQSQIYIQPVQTKLLPQGNDSSEPINSTAYDSFVQQQVQSASNPEVLINALHKLGAGAWQKKNESEQAAADRLGHAVEVARAGTSYEVTITAKAKNAALSANIANTVANSIVERAAGEGNAGDQERITVLQEERDRIQGALKADYAEQDDLNKQLGMAAVGTAAPDLIDDQISKTRDELIKAQTDHDEAEARFTSMQASKGSTAIDAEADDLVATDAGLTSMKTSLNQRRATLITQMANLTPNNPAYKQDAEELSKIDSSLDSMMKDLRAKASVRIQQKLRTDLERSADVESKLNGQLGQLARSAASATPKLQRVNDLATDIVRLRNRFSIVDEQLHNLMLQDSVPGAVHLSVAAVPPLHPALSGILKKALPLALGGILFGLLAAVVANKLDQRVYIAADVEEVLGFPPMAVLPDFAEVSDGVAAEQLLRLSSAIDHARRQGGLKSCIFTGTAPGAGVTTVANRVRDILVAMGTPTVLLDATKTAAPEPRVNAGANLMYTAWNGQAVQRGSRSTALLKQVAAHSEREQETLVVTDTAPLTISAETEHLARSVDSAIVVIQSGVTTRAQVLAALQALQRLEVGTIGFVLNRVGLENAGPIYRRSIQEIEEHLSHQDSAAKVQQPPSRPLAEEIASYPELAAVAASAVAVAAHSLPEPADESPAKKPPAEPSPESPQAPPTRRIAPVIAEWPKPAPAKTPAANPAPPVAAEAPAAQQQPSAVPWWLQETQPETSKVQDEPASHPAAAQPEVSHSASSAPAFKPKPLPDWIWEPNTNRPQAFATPSAANLAPAEPVAVEPEVAEIAESRPQHENYELATRLKGLKGLLSSGLKNLRRSQGPVTLDEALQLPAQAVLEPVAPQPVAPPAPVRVAAPETPASDAVSAPAAVYASSVAPAPAVGQVKASTVAEPVAPPAQQPVIATPSAPVAAVPATPVQPPQPPPAQAVPPLASQVSAAPTPAAVPPRQITAQPEFLSPREFVPMQDSTRPGASSDNRWDQDDDIHTLPSKRGQYKRR
jgi:uncharacterized protein involved in exopolysaccharide biosynthesis